MKLLSLGKMISSFQWNLAQSDLDEKGEFTTSMMSKEEKQKRKLLEQKVIDDAPKVLFANAVAGSDTSIHVGDLAKFICQNGVKIGRGRLFAWMRENGYLVKDGSNIPTQRSIENGWMEIKESVVETKNGTLVTRTPLVTGKGQRFFVNRILRHKEVSYSVR